MTYTTWLIFEKLDFVLVYVVDHYTVIVTSSESLFFRSSPLCNNKTDYHSSLQEQGVFFFFSFPPPHPTLQASPVTCFDQQNMEELTLCNFRSSVLKDLLAYTLAFLEPSFSVKKSRLTAWEERS